MNNNEGKVLSLLGLAARGRNVVSGETQVLEAIRDGSAFLVVLAGDASENTRKRFQDKAGYYEVPLVFVGTKESLGHAIGKEFRSSLAVCEQGFAHKIYALSGGLEGESE